MRQVNIVGTSPPSQPSRKIQTLQAPPDMAPANVTLRTASETSLWLRWVVCSTIKTVHWAIETNTNSIFLFVACWSASSWMGVQREPRFGGLPCAVQQDRSSVQSPAARHCRSPGERVHHRRPGGVDRVWGQSSGHQRHWSRTLESTCTGKNQRVR